jgi:hypothetical protein
MTSRTEPAPARIWALNEHAYAEVHHAPAGHTVHIPGRFGARAVCQCGWEGEPRSDAFRFRNVIPLEVIDHWAEVAS